MPHQCVHCGEIYPDAAEELLKGCKCSSKFFYYINKKKLDELDKINDSEIEQTLTQLNKADKEQIEQDIREITGMKDEPDKPVVLDLESVRVLGPGKFEIDLINLFSKKRPIIYRLEEGKYVIDLSSSIKVDSKEIGKKIRDPKDYIEKKDEKETRVIGENKDETDEVEEDNDEVGKKDEEVIDVNDTNEDEEESKEDEKIKEAKDDMIKEMVGEEDEEEKE
ncbi:hypothetical protein GOV12_02770 [Candidatus Pacearchaeota archaeon]|nr:hypothetical protein [Candidatus Pacearchaeota archaeon]